MDPLWNPGRIEPGPGTHFNKTLATASSKFQYKSTTLSLHYPLLRELPLTETSTTLKIPLMELCTTATTSSFTIPSITRLRKVFPTNSAPRLRPQLKFPLKQSLCTHDSSSIGISPYSTEEDRAVTVIEDSLAVEKKETNEEVPAEESPVNDRSNDLLSNLNIKFDSQDSYSILLYGAGALVGLWLASAVVSAVDSIPLFPKLMEVVGLGYTFWFTTRYLLFKKNRDELFTKFEEVKQQVLGSNDD